MISGGITRPKGFRASGIKAGLKSSGKPDLALLVAPQGAICSGTFTKSYVRAACIDLCVDRLRLSDGKVRALLINSGHANACTGDHGLGDSLLATKALSERLGINPEQVLMCSTGVIGELIPMDKLLAGLDPLVESLSDGGGSAAAQAILTTDLVEKQIAVEGYLEGRRVRIGGMAKGSGMIHPNMSTMLGYLTCDAGVPIDTWRRMIGKVVDCSFNSITVDGDTSTNDAFLALSAGEPLQKASYHDLEIGLRLVAQHLAKAIARDGEGANALIEVQVEGTGTDGEARQIARTICGSSLVKTAVHGADPNWGRIVAAAGRAGIALDLKRLSLWIGHYQLMSQGAPLDFDRQAVSTYMKQRLHGDYMVDDSVCIRLNVGEEPSLGFAWGCDLSDRYVRINADYTT